MSTKICSKCRKELSIDFFYKNRCMKDGYDNQCKICKKENSKKRDHKKYFEENREKILESQKNYYQNNKEKIKQKAKEYRERIKTDDEKRNQRNLKSRERYEKNKEKIREYQRKWYNEHKEEYQKKHSEYYFKNIDKVKKYREANKEHFAEIQKRIHYEKMENDELYRFKQKVRGSINKSFKRQNVEKSKHTIEILGCDIDFFQEYLKQTFFNNYGYEYDGIEKVHIDHIIPLATAKTVEEVEKLCHYTNLQLLKPKDNIRKGAKLIY